ncbi:MAG TPA: deoxyguanosinetriphosphate triphosphohydrolase, partial [Terriglobia bacterium]|nr:deoxyguanosinetriphosphate triphosphohydrolase [Terriglobia bacterium]
AFPGLNLTFEVREGIVKHSKDYNLREHPELAEYLLNERPPLEAQLIDVADEIAYNCADLDDGYESKLLSLGVIRDNVPLFDKLYRPVHAKYPGAAEKLKFNEGLRRLVDALVTDLIGAVRNRLRQRRIRSVVEVRALKTRLAGFNPGMAEKNQQLKRFLQDCLYAHPNLSRERKKITQHIEQLFNHYLRHPKALPASHFAKVPREPLTQVVCDYIAGMTDNFFAQQYQRISGE